MKVPTANEAGKILTDHTFLIDPNSIKLSKKHDKQVTEVPRVQRNFKNSRADGEVQ